MTPQTDRREHARRHPRVLWDLLFRALRMATRRVDDFRVALGIVLVGGITVAVTGTWLFTLLADSVREGQTEAADTAVLRWLGAHRIPWVESSLLEITALGTGLVVLLVIGVAALFLWLTRHRYSATLLLVATAGGIALNGVLKFHFARPRPEVFVWRTTAVSSSFPSGHAMNAAIAYSTVAYLAARLQRRRWARWLTMLVAGGIISLVALSRLYLGVHYPSDVIAGVVIGLAWAAFCMATLEAVQRYGERNAPHVAEHEKPPPAPLEPDRTTAGAA